MPTAVPHMESIATMLATCTCHNPFNLDDPTHNFHELARSKTSADPAVCPACKRTEKRVPIAASLLDIVQRYPLCPCPTKRLRPEHHSRTRRCEYASRRGCDLELGLCSQMPTRADRNPIRLPLSIAVCANSTLANGIWPSCTRAPLSYRRRLYARRSFPSSRSAVYDMHCDYQHCLPPVPAFCSCTTRNAMRSVTTRSLLVYAHALSTSPGASYIRQAAGAAVPRRARCPRKSEGAATIFSEVTPQRPPRGLHAPQLGCATPPPCATPATFILHPICRFPHLPPACDDDLRRSPILPLDACPSRVAQQPSAPQPTCAALAVAFLHRRPALRRLMCRPIRFLGPPSIQQHPCTPDARLPACAAFDAVRIYSTKKLPSRTRNVPLRRVTPTSAPPPRRNVACAIRRDYQRHRLSLETVYSTTTLRVIAHATTNPLHAACDVLRDCDVTSTQAPTLRPIAEQQLRYKTPYGGAQHARVALSCACLSHSPAVRRPPLRPLRPRPPPQQHHKHARHPHPYLQKHGSSTSTRTRTIPGSSESAQLMSTLRTDALSRLCAPSHHSRSPGAIPPVPAAESSDSSTRAMITAAPPVCDHR
ncbi:hypothetical protein B0H14DRAFT_3899976 [Mycena olivaceomarginata]|nr:hypothetical protein B0H14DRAFT_3899976 [Mycena olivaceomarginata]